MNAVTSNGRLFAPITEEDIYTFFNKRACDTILPNTLKRVLEWGCNKLPRESFYEYLHNRHDVATGSWKKYMNRWTKSDELKLQQGKTEGLDVTLLVKLIPEVCENVATCGADAWQSHDEGKVEVLLRKIKDLRNEVMHELRGAAISPNTLKEMKRLLKQLLLVSGIKYHIDTNVINNERDLLDGQFEKLKQTVMTGKEKRIVQVQQKFIIDGISEMRSKFTENGNIKMPIGKRKVSIYDVFYKLNLIPDLKSESTEAIPCSELFNLKEDEENKNFHIVKGISGSGKSTLLRHIAQDSLSIGSRMFEGLGTYDLVLYVECRNPNIANLGDLLKLLYNKTLEKVETPDAEDACKNLRKLVIIDGIDEMNDKSRALVNQLVSLFGSQVEFATFIVSSRPHAESSITKLCKEKYIQYSAWKIQNIEDTNQQVAFLKKYKRIWPKTDDKNDIIDAFQKLDEHVRRHFITPIHLTLFCDAFYHFNGKIDNWTSECGAMRETIKLCRTKMIERLEQQAVSDSNIISKIVLQTVCKVSLEFLRRDIFHIDTDSYEDVCIEIYDRVKQKINCNEVMSCIWSPVSSFHDSSEVIYEFFHKSHQEYMAARHIINCLNKNSKLSISKIIEDFLPSDLGTADLKKLQNCFKFLTIELFESSKLSHYLPEICRMLQDSSVGFSYCVDLIRCCDNSVEVAENLTIVLDKKKQPGDEDSRDWWKVYSNSLVPATMLLLNKMLPSALEINIPSSSPILSTYVDLMTVLREKEFQGILNLNLWNSYENFEPCDQVLLPLKDMSCKLWQFSGCLSTYSSIAALNKLGETARLFISLPNNLTSDILKSMKQDHFSLTVTVLYSNSTLLNESSCGSLPGSPKPRDLQYMNFLPPTLIIVDVPRDGANTLNNIICNLAPKDKRFYEIILEGCAMQDKVLLGLIKDLKASGIKTDGFGSTHFTNIGCSTSGSCFQCRRSHREDPRYKCIRLIITEGADVTKLDLKNRKTSVYNF